MQARSGLVGLSVRDYYVQTEGGMLVFSVLTEHSVVSAVVFVLADAHTPHEKEALRGHHTYAPFASFLAFPSFPGCTSFSLLGSGFTLFPRITCWSYFFPLGENYIFLLSP